MAKIFPFRGILYNKKKIKKLSNVISPPYDVISRESQDILYEMSDFNLVRLILGKEFPGDNEYNNKYVRAAASFEGWLRHGILTRDEKPAVYIYEQKYVYMRKSYSRVGLIALSRLEDGGKGKIFPHEHTLSKPKLDRIDLMRATSSNFDCVFSVFQDEKGKFVKIVKKQMRRKPDCEAKDDQNVLNRLWRVNQKGVISRLQKEFKDKSVFIADGHHRFEAALRFKEEMKIRNTRFTEEESYNHIMMYFTPAENPGLLVLPIHRLIKNIGSIDIQHVLIELGVYFEILEIPFSKRTQARARKKLLSDIVKFRERHAFGLYFKGIPSQYYIVVLKDEAVMQDLIEEQKPASWKKLDVTILHALVLGNILGVSGEDNVAYAYDAEAALDKVASGEFEAAALLNPTRIEEIVSIAGAYERMPQKSTYFYPKLASGLVMNKIIHGERIE